MTERDANGANEPLWRLIPLHEFSAPQEPTSEVVRSGVRELWNRLVHRQGFAEPNGFDSPELRSAPTRLLDYLAPVPNWPEDVGADVGDKLRRQIETSNRSVVLVAPPHSGIADAVKQWAASRDYRLIAEPTLLEILSGGRDWLDKWPVDPSTHPSTYTVLPYLERYFLRHHHGLALVRTLLAQLTQNRQQVLIVCDSWAWAYLGYVSPEFVRTAWAFTLAPLHAAEQLRWIRESVRRNNRSTVYRRADNGKRVVQSDNPDDEEVSMRYWQILAAYSRGNPGVSWPVWRRSLYIAVDEDDMDEDVKPEARDEAENDRGRTIWVRPWDRLDLPSLANVGAGVNALVLHALLIHGGLPYDALERLLPIPPPQVRAALADLEASEIIELDETGEGRFRVSAIGYPTTRSFLRREGFLLDAL